MSVSKNIQNNPINKFVLGNKWKFVFLAIVCIIIILVDVSPFGGGIRFYAKWIECGQKPLSETVEIGLGAQIPSYHESSAFPAFRMQAEYFCTPLEAEQAGYSASPASYEFPHLKE